MEGVALSVSRVCCASPSGSSRPVDLAGMNVHVSRENLRVTGPSDSKDEPWSVAAVNGWFHVFMSGCFGICYGCTSNRAVVFEAPPVFFFRPG